MQTLNQVIQRLQELAESHKQIKYFFAGPADAFLDDSAALNYPACFCELKGGTISASKRVTNYSFVFYFFDLLATATNSNDNEWEVKSDMVSIAEDYLALLLDREYTGWEIEDTEYQFEVKDYQFSDLAAGVSVGVTIGLRFAANKCQVPLN